MRKLSRIAVLGALVATIVGCGGGGGDSSASNLPGQAPGGTNAAPTIVGTPSNAVLVGQAYSFTPTAADPNGDALTFTVTNAPSWTTFNASTGRLSGTPTVVGTHSNITIRVSDGTSTTTLAAFSITVTATATGSATVSWTPPTQNTDGTAVTLTGYEIRYGKNPNALDLSININTGGVASAVVPDLTAGTWYFSVSARGSSGVTSVPSELASKTVS